MPASARSSENVPVSYPRETRHGVWTDNKNAHLHGFLEALFRTRTGDPLLTMQGVAVPPCPRESTKALHSAHFSKREEDLEGTLVDNLRCP